MKSQNQHFLRLRVFIQEKDLLLVCRSATLTHQDFTTQPLSLSYVQLLYPKDHNAMKRISVILATVLSLAFTPVAAQDFQKGLAAFRAGDYASALQEWVPLAEAGDANAQVVLGSIYYIGRGVPQDYAEAAKWFLLSANQGNAQAQSSLGDMYNDAHDFADALKWYRLAANQGHASAQSSLGKMYEYGIIVLQDNAIAHMWYNIGAANGNEISGTNRDSIAEGMTSADISKAQAMARECMSSGYQNCGY